ncbi:PepSY domain-containing protein [Thalassococcus lentus]|uniref:PepSY domain-containing protein n=1 Tax=Thalassococcus lentus TaxID=1210524 RepID=A0ABT4XSG6_9RHOB|nr:PepSY domain-containing protein [Thalassococcus lentus]MDA7424899.1 PepSY domain-containing protein [Thalassococcus lentus]
MDKKFIAGGALTGLLLSAGIAGMVSAQSAATATGLSEEQVIAIALAEVPGEVQEVELERHRGQQVYEVEILAADGSEMEVEIAAESGDVLKVKADGEDCDKHDDDEEEDA